MSWIKRITVYGGILLIPQLIQLVRKFNSLKNKHEKSKRENIKEGINHVFYNYLSTNITVSCLMGEIFFSCCTEGLDVGFTICNTLINGLTYFLSHKLNKRTTSNLNTILGSIEYDEGNYYKSFNLFKKSEEYSDSAKYNLGISYAYGNGVPKNEEKAFSYIRESAE